METCPDTRTLADLAAEALYIQDATNLSGVVHSWSRSVRRLRELMSGAGTDEINKHPINVLYADKLMSLSGGRDDMGGFAYSAAYDRCVGIAHRVLVADRMKS